MSFSKKVAISAIGFAFTASALLTSPAKAANRNRPEIDVGGGMTIETHRMSEHIATFYAKMPQTDASGRTKMKDVGSILVDCSAGKEYVHAMTKDGVLKSRRHSNGGVESTDTNLINFVCEGERPTFGKKALPILGLMNLGKLNR